MKHKLESNLFGGRISQWNDPKRKTRFRDAEEAVAYTKTNPKRFVENGSWVNVRYLTRFLKKAVGRPWNDVYSEITKVVTSTHARQIVFNLIKNSPFPNEIETTHGFLLGCEYFYVDSDGILRIDAKTKRYHAATDVGDADLVRLKDTDVYFFRNGDVWFKIATSFEEGKTSTSRRVVSRDRQPEAVHLFVTDSGKKTPMERFLVWYGSGFRHHGKIQLNRKETSLLKAELANTNATARYGHYYDAGRYISEKFYFAEITNDPAPRKKN